MLVCWLVCPCQAWDLRALRGLYELSTGNTVVKTLHWMTDVSCLVAQTESPHIDDEGCALNYNFLPQDMHRKVSVLPHNTLALSRFCLTITDA